MIELPQSEEAALKQSSPATESTPPAVLDTPELPRTSVGLPIQGGMKRTGDDSLNELEGIRFEITGNSSFSSQEIIDSLRLPAGRSVNSLESSSQLQVALFYKKRGFADVSVQSVASEETVPILVQITVEEGNIYMLRKLSFQGNIELTAQELRTLYPPSDKPADVPGLNRTDKLLRDRYRNAGFLDAGVVGNTRVDRSTMDVMHVVRIHEGPRYRVSSVNIPTHLEADFPFRRGDVYSPRAVRSFLKTLSIPSERFEAYQDPNQGTVELTIYE